MVVADTVSKRTFDIPDEVYERLKKWAREDGMTIADFIVWILSDYAPPEEWIVEES